MPIHLGGWWQYDPRSSSEIEGAYQQQVAELELTLCGSLYCINFNDSVQFKRSHPMIKRKIKRDRIGTLRSKGVAGILTPP